MDNLIGEIITVDELCETLMIGKNAAYKLLSSGDIKAFRINRIWKIPRQSVTEYIYTQITQSPTTD
ncbi:helix-turn-helix domain-containing protein [Anaerosinus gibii]|uniref:Helix-turn-helix domain-containing protein n=1 Tax=Selenobaculum gibii TaxID=3054208 RepID=A0A9Y2ES31_9FIRM|nr:helix-turn-helix domain-containing protein [Selenobaculum gbiensis]WIW69886.1 helix-turn-helix domain-containing protein [Selenobaculum gbiensis]